MRAVCPKNSKHRRFVTVAHVSEEWIVDERGQFLQTLPGGESETVAEPRPENTWQCFECGAEAAVTE